MVFIVNMRNNTPVSNESRRYDGDYRERRFSGEARSFQDTQSNHEGNFGYWGYQEEESIVGSDDFDEISRENEESLGDSGLRQVARSSEQMFLPDLDSVALMQSFASPIIADFDDASYPNNSETQDDSENTVRRRRSNLGDRILDFNEIDARALAILLEGLQNIPEGLRDANNSGGSNIAQESVTPGKRLHFDHEERDDGGRYIR